MAELLADNFQAYMAIANELSSDIAAALIAASDKDPRHLCELKEILIEVHSTLQQMTEQCKLARRIREGVDSDRLGH